MLRVMSTGAAEKAPEMVKKTGEIVAAGPSAGSYVLRVEGKTYNQVWSTNLLSYSIGSFVQVFMDRGIPIIVP